MSVCANDVRADANMMTEVLFVHIGGSSGDGGDAIIIQIKNVAAPCTDFCILLQIFVSLSHHASFFAR